MSFTEILMLFVCVPLKGLMVPVMLAGPTPSIIAFKAMSACWSCSVERPAMLPFTDLMVRLTPGWIERAEKLTAVLVMTIAPMEICGSGEFVAAMVGRAFSRAGLELAMFV